MSLREAFLSGSGCPIVDTHAHLGPFRAIYLPEAALDDMIGGMDRCGVESIWLAPHSALHGDTREGNREMLDAVQAHPGRVYGYCTVNPNFPADIPEELDRYLDEPGVLGIKAHPTIHEHPITGPNYRAALERVNAEKRLMLCHTWGKDGGCGAGDMRKVAETYPDIRLLLGHSCYGAWEEAIALAAEFPNVYLELTAAAHVYGLLEWMCREAGSEKVLYGTDYPWFDHMAYAGFVTYAHIQEDEMRNILYKNAKRLLEEQIGQE